MQEKLEGNLRTKTSRKHYGLDITLSFSADEEINHHIIRPIHHRRWLPISALQLGHKADVASLLSK